MASLGGGPKKRPRFPLGVLVSYGPDEATVAKIVVSVMPSLEGPASVVKKWFGPTVATDAQVDAELRQFLRTQRVKTLMIQPGVFGCPHEEGMDFPQGGDCPHCPFWKGKQGSGAEVEERWAKFDLRKMRLVDVNEPGVRWSWR